MAKLFRTDCVCISHFFVHLSVAQREDVHRVVCVKCPKKKHVGLVLPIRGDHDSTLDIDLRSLHVTAADIDPSLSQSPRTEHATRAGHETWTRTHIGVY